MGCVSALILGEFSGLFGGVFGLCLREISDVFGSCVFIAVLTEGVLRLSIGLYTICSI